jgi:hypothetical protein
MKHKAYKRIIIFVVLFAVLSYVAPLGTASVEAAELQDPLKGKTFTDLAQGIVKGIRQIAIPVAVIMILVAGILFMISRGDPGRITTAKRMFTYTLVGFAIILMAEGFLALIKSILQLGE